MSKENPIITGIEAGAESVGQAQSGPQAGPQAESTQGWRSARECPPPSDGTEIVMVGELASQIEDDLFEVDPVCGMVRHEGGEWVCAATGRSICLMEEDELTIHFWIAAPSLKREEAV